MVAATPVVMLVGPSGVGKTSFGRHLAAHLDVPLLSSDKMMVERHGSAPPRDQFDQLQARVREDIWAEVEHRAQQQQGSILDLGFWTRAGRRRSIERIGKIPLALDIVIEVTCDPAVARSRALERTQRHEPDQLAIDAAALDQFAQMWEPLVSGEAHFTIDGRADPEAQMSSYRTLIRCGLV